jgi:hypothetical protein
MRSVLHANGANPLTFCASAICTSQPQRSRVSCTNRAPFIDSIAAHTGPGPWRNSTNLTSPASASASGATAPRSTLSPSPPSRQ